MKKNISGIKIFKKNIITDDRGKILHMMRIDDDNFRRFGEIYFSYVNPSQIKAWHIHKKMTLNYVAAYGKIKLVLYDDREISPTNGMVQEIILSNDNHLLVSIPPMIWMGFQGLDSDVSLLLNIANIVHSPEESDRKTVDSIKYNWR